eukprot:350353-Chlamydomonas_euryale.AAC.6
MALLFCGSVCKPRSAKLGDVCGGPGAGSLAVAGRSHDSRPVPSLVLSFNLTATERVIVSSSTVMDGQASTVASATPARSQVPGQHGHKCQASCTITVPTVQRITEDLENISA